MVGNLLGEVTEEEAMAKATHVAVPRFEPRDVVPPAGMEAEEHRAWVKMWEQMSLGDLHGFPVWEREVHEMLLRSLGVLRSIFVAYAASSIGTADDSTTMDFEELHDFVIETGLPTEGYGWQVPPSPRRRDAVLL